MPKVIWNSAFRISLAEWEWAWKYWEYLTLGDPDPEPDSAGFDPDRIKEIRRALSAEYHKKRGAFYGDIRNRVRGT